MTILYNISKKMVSKGLALMACLTVALLLSSCQFRKVEWVDFNSFMKSEGSNWFQPYSVVSTSMKDGVPDNCYLPGGYKANEYTNLCNQGVIDESGTAEGSLKTTSTSMANVLQNLIQYHNNEEVVQISGTYLSEDENGKPIKLSGKVLLPLKKPVQRYILVSHYTIGSNAEAPSNCFPMEGVLCANGYAMIFPDYLGYGVTSNKIHPYLSMKLTAKNVLDMYTAVKPYIESLGYKPKYDDIYLMGYSQGGSNTMAVQYMIEDEKYVDVKIKRVFAGGGPYDIVATYNSVITSGKVSYPCAVPLVIQGMNQGSNMGLNMSRLLVPRIADNVDAWFNSKKYTTSQLNQLIGTYKVEEILTEYGRDRTSEDVAVLYKAMKNNSVVGLSFWIPMAPVYMLHSMDDETVPYINAQHAKSAWHESNIQYNVGHYGTHVNTALRFIYSVSTLLKEEEN